VNQAKPRILEENMLKLFPSPVRHSALGAKSDRAAVRLIDSPRRLPETVIEQRLASRLKESGPVSLSALVTGVAADLYSDELRTGAGVLDIGLFGSRLFNGEVVHELETGNGILWEIERDGTTHD
jgi:hypothetical protein